MAEPEEPSKSASSPQPMAARIKRGALWVVAGAVVGNLMRLCSNLIMTRLLLPEAYGMLALATIVLTAVTLSTDMGIHRSISREPDGSDPKFLRVAWVVKIMRSALIAALILIVAFLVWLLAPSLAAPGTIYVRPEMPGLIALVAVAPILRGFSSTSWELAIRQLDQRSIVLWSAGPLAISIVAMVVFASISPTVWALMFGMLVNQLVQTIGTHLFLSGPRMRFVWDKEIADRLWQFGKWIMGASALGFVSRNVDKFVLSALLSATLFGLYVIAQIWVEAARSLVQQIGDRIGFPALAEASRTRKDELPRLFRRFQYRIDAIIVATFTLLVIGAQPLISLLYTDTYHDAGRYLQWMAFLFLGLRFNTLSTLVMNAGNSRAITIISAIQAVASVVLMTGGYQLMEVKGAIFGMVIASITGLPYLLTLVRPLVGDAQYRIELLWACAVVVVIALGIAFL